MVVVLDYPTKLSIRIVVYPNIEITAIVVIVVVFVVVVVVGVVG
jgi:hypothetical protein